MMSVVKILSYLDLSIRTMFGSSSPPVVCRRAHVLIMLFVFVWVKWCPIHIVLCFCFVFFRIVYPMLPVSVDCPFLFSPSVFSNVYLSCVPYVASFSGLSIFVFPFGIL